MPTYRIMGKNLATRMKDRGLIHPAILERESTGEYTIFFDVLDYHKCNEFEAEDYIKERMAEYDEPYFTAYTKTYHPMGWKAKTAKELKDMVGYFSQSPNDIPIYFICTAFPYEHFAIHVNHGLEWTKNYYAVGYKDEDGRCSVYYSDTEEGLIY